MGGARARPCDQLAPELDALLVFAEHRYEGESVPELIGTPDCLAYASVEQALADYATVISTLRAELGAAAVSAGPGGGGADGAAPPPPAVPFVAVGGSYGGMLAAWLRFKYPSAVVGAIAASAPIWGLPLVAPPLDGSAVATSRGLGAAGGLASDACADHLLAAWSLLEVDRGRKKTRASL